MENKEWEENLENLIIEFVHDEKEHSIYKIFGNKNREEIHKNLTKRLYFCLQHKGETICVTVSRIHHVINPVHVGFFIQKIETKTIKT